MLSLLLAGCCSGDCENRCRGETACHWRGTECALPMAIRMEMCANPTILAGKSTADVNSGARLRRYRWRATAAFGRSVPGSVNPLYPMAKLDAFRYRVGLAHPSFFVVMVNNYY